MAKAAPTKQFNIISVGSYTIKAIRCQVADKKLSLLGWQTHALELSLTTQSPFSEYAVELEKAFSAFRDGVFKGFSDVHILFSSSFLMVKVLGVPEFAKADLKLVLQDKLERDNAISSKPNGLKDFDYVTQVFESLKEEDKVEEQMDLAVLTCLCEKSVFETLSSLTVRFGFRMRGLWSESVAMAGLLSRCDPQTWAEQVALVNIGHTLTSFHIFSEGKLLFYRPIFTAGQQITKDVLAITNDETIDIKQAEELKHKMTLNPKSVDVAKLTPLEALIHNISEQAILKEFSLVRKLDITFEYLSINIKKRIKKVYYTGGSSLLSGLLDYVSKNTSLPKGEFFDVHESVLIDPGVPGADNTQSFASFSACFGLAYALDGEVYKDLNLVKKVAAFDLFKPENLKELLRTHAFRFIVGAELLATVLGGAFLGWSYVTNQAAIESLEAKVKQKKMLEASLPQNAEKPEDLQEQMKQQDLRLSFYRDLLGTRRDWVNLFAAISRCVPEEGLALTSMTTKLIQKKVEKPKPAGRGAGEGASGEGAGAGAQEEGLASPAAGPAASAAGAGDAAPEPSIEMYEPELVLKGTALSRTPIIQFQDALQKLSTVKNVSLEKIGSVKDVIEGGDSSDGAKGVDGPGTGTPDEAAAQGLQLYFTIRARL